MYSVVLMAALNTSLTMPDRHRGGGCCGCYGGGWGGCYGGGWGGCYGGWGGCWGGGWGGCFGGYGMGWGGCFGGYPMVVGGGFGCWGGHAIVVGGVGGCLGGGQILGGQIIAPHGHTGGTPAHTGGAKSKDKDKDGDRDDGRGKSKSRDESEESSSEREEARLNTDSTEPVEAVLVVSLPADAKLLIDDKPTRSTGSTRVFVSPKLEGGRAYTYELKGEVLEGGQPRTISQRVEVEPGKETHITLSFPSAALVWSNPLLP